MKYSSIIDKFKDRKGTIMGKHKKSAVMLLLCEDKGELSIVFEVRALTLRSQPGDVCLPGGRIEEGENALDTAVRETMEELNLGREDFEVLGELDYFVSPYGSIMYPFVAILKKGEIIPNRAEVDHIFKVPLKFFTEKDPITYEMKLGPYLTEDFPYHLVRGGKEYKFSKGVLNQYFYIYKDYVIWGFTAMIIKHFVDMAATEED